MNELPENLRRIADDAGLGEAFDRELSNSPEIVRNDCAFCGRERTRKDDNHAPGCAYWSFFGGNA